MAIDPPISLPRARRMRNAATKRRLWDAALKPSVDEKAGSQFATGTDRLYLIEAMLSQLHWQFIGQWQETQSCFDEVGEAHLASSLLSSYGTRNFVPEACNECNSVTASSKLWQPSQVELFEHLCIESCKMKLRHGYRPLSAIGTCAEMQQIPIPHLHKINCSLVRVVVWMLSWMEPMQLGNTSATCVTHVMRCCTPTAYRSSTHCEGNGAYVQLAWYGFNMQSNVICARCRLPPGTEFTTCSRMVVNMMCV